MMVMRMNGDCGVDEIVGGETALLPRCAVYVVYD